MKKFLEKQLGWIDEQALLLLSDIAHEINVKKDEYLLREGKLCKYLWFLKKGAIKAFELSNGEIRNTHFFTEECFLTNYISILTQQPSTLNFQAVEDCLLLRLEYDKLENLYAKNQYLEHIGRKMAEMQFVSEHSLRRQLLNMDALERYEHLEASHPEVFARFALKDIASYLGITPVSLSRLRKYRFDRR
jgi:CRP-like cAMP-binding protein